MLDDLVVYRFPEHYMLVVNAANIEKDRVWIATHADALDAQFLLVGHLNYAQLVQQANDLIGRINFMPPHTAKVGP